MEEHSQPAELHLKRAVCDVYQGKEKHGIVIFNPQYGKPTVEIHYDPHNKKSQEFMTEQLNYLLHTLKILLTWKLFHSGELKQQAKLMNAKIRMWTVTQQDYT